MIPKDDSGMAVGFLRSAFASMGIQAHFVFMPPKRALEAFYKGEGLLISSFGLLKDGDYTMLRLTMVRAGIYRLKSAPLKKETGYLRGVHRAEKAIAKEGLTPVAVSSYEAGLKMLASGRIGQFMGPIVPLNYAISHASHDISLQLGQSQKNVYRESGGLLAQSKDLYILEALQEHISNDRMRSFYKETVKTELGPYLGQYKLEDYIWDDFKLIHIKDNVVELSD